MGFGGAPWKGRGIGGADLDRASSEAQDSDGKEDGKLVASGARIHGRGDAGDGGGNELCGQVRIEGRVDLLPVLMSCQDSRRQASIVLVT